MRAIPSLDFSHPQPEVKSLRNFGQSLQKSYRNLVGVVNGKIGYGDGQKSDNIDGVWQTVTFPVANADVVITHNLGRIPVGYHIMTKSVSCDVYNGSIASTKTQITLRGTVAGATVSLFLL